MRSKAHRHQPPSRPVSKSDRSPRPPSICADCGAWWATNIRTAPSLDSVAVGWITVLALLGTLAARCSRFSTPLPTPTTAPTAIPTTSAPPQIDPAWQADIQGLLSPLVTFRHLPLDSGLSQSVATSIVQDRQGFIWIGTQDGLNRFDGQSFKIYKDERTQTVPIIFIIALNEIEDKVLAFQSGGVDYITKPFQVEEVLARTNTHLALQRLQMQLESRNRRLEREMELAGKVQASFLPHTLVHVEGWDLSACLHPARATSGDFYDVLPLPGDQLGLLIADVVDKGVPAALLMAMSWGLLCSHTSEGDKSPVEVFDQVNHTLVQHLGGMQFLTAFLGILEPASGRLAYANAGHPPPLLLAADAQEPIRLGRTGPPLGVSERSTWEDRDVTIAQGEVILFYTDGITEATRQDSFYGLKRLALTARGLWPSDGAESLLSGVFDDVRAFASDEPQSDDIALLTVARQVARASASLVQPKRYAGRPPVPHARIARSHACLGGSRPSYALTNRSRTRPNPCRPPTRPPPAGSLSAADSPADSPCLGF